MAVKLSEVTTNEQLSAIAERWASPLAWAYVTGVAGSGLNAERALRAFEDAQLVPSVLQDSAVIVDPSTDLFGSTPPFRWFLPRRPLHALCIPAGKYLSRELRSIGFLTPFRHSARPACKMSRWRRLGAITGFSSTQAEVERSMLVYSATRATQDSRCS